MRELGSKFNFLMKYLQAESRPLFKCFNATFLKRQIKYLIKNLLIHLTAQMFCGAQRTNGLWTLPLMGWWLVWFRQRAGMRKAAHVCSSCSMHQCLWDGSPGLDHDGCQDPGWAHYPDIIKGLKWKPFGDYSNFTNFCTLLCWCDAQQWLNNILKVCSWTLCNS